MKVTGATFSYTRSGAISYQVCGSYKTIGFSDGSGYTVNCFPYNDFPDNNPDIPLTTPANCYAVATIVVSASTKLTVAVGAYNSSEKLLGDPSHPSGNEPPLCLCTGDNASLSLPYSDFAGSETTQGATNAVGDPISAATGNLYESAVDYATAGPNVLMFARYYNSQGDPGTAALSLGSNWRSNFDRYVRIETASAVMVERADGQELPFTLSNGVWVSDTDVDEKLTNSGSTWTLIDRNDATETFTAINSSLAVLSSWRARNGYTQTMNRNTSHQLTSVTDSFGRTLTIGYYTNGLLETVANPDGLTITYTYGSSGVKAGVQDRLATVVYPTSPLGTLTYLYENSSLPFALTGITDENAQRYATWTYDIAGRALSSYLGPTANPANQTKISYNDTTGARTITNALGVSDTYVFSTLQGVSKLTEIDRAATTTTKAATRLFGYDANGYLKSETDWDGILTTFVNDVHGQVTTMVEGSGSSQARTTTIAWEPSFHLPHIVTRAGLTSTLTHDASGNLQSKSDLDTTTSSKPYATAGQTRTWSYTWNNYGLVATSTTPRTDLTATTNYTWDSNGALVKIVNPLKQTVQITAHTGGGRPQTVLDENNVTTTLAYDQRQRLASKVVTTSAGKLTTSFGYDLAGNLTSTVLPDGSTLTNSFDPAHRLTGVVDSLGNSISYTLDGLGDHTGTNVYNKAGTLQWQSSGNFDALGREYKHVAGAGQTTLKSYDPHGNLLTVADGLSQTTTLTYDALNRLSTSTDANMGVTTPAFDTNNQIISVTDANGNSTTYVRDGFGDVIQQSSPDSGVTVFYYDDDANLTTKTDALGVVTRQTFDALDRPLTTTYPAHTVENVTYTYDQTGTGFGFGVGHLTSVTDAAGSLTRAYDERNNLITEKRTNGSTVLSTAYTYDGASRVAGMTYPDGTQVTYNHDAAGYASTVLVKPAGASTTTTLATLTHLPFGPINGNTYGNGVVETWGFDQSYRPTSIVDTLSGSNLQNLAYGYDAANNVKTITDTVNSANSQTFVYDVLNRLKSATSGAGGYGSQSWTYDNVGNRSTQVQGSATTKYGYTPGTNRLLSITTTITKAALQHPGALKQSANSNWVVAAKSAPPARGAESAKGPAVGVPHNRASLLAFGFPMLFLGVSGVFGLRKKLLANKLLGLSVLVFFLSGTTAVFLGCGGGSGSQSSPTLSPTATPTFTPSGGSYNAVQNVTIADATPGATIYYTTNGSTPTTTSTPYTGSISVMSSETIEAIAIASGYSTSAIASASFTINLPAAATPVFSPPGGTFTSTPVVSITDSTPGATIYFTTDGSTPTTSSPKYVTPFGPGSSPETFSAIAAAPGYSNSAVAVATYVVTPLAATPTFSPGAGTYSSAQTVTIADTTSGSSIYYTTDGSTPTTSSTKYASPISVSSTETVSAIATATGYASSAPGVAAYTIVNPCMGNVATNANGNITSVPSGDGLSCLTFTYNNANRPASVAGGILGATFVYDWSGQRYSKTNGGLPPTIYSYSQNGAIIAENDGGTVTDYVYVDGRPIATVQPTTATANQISYVTADRLGTPQRVTNASGSTVWGTSYQPFGTTGTITASAVQNLRFPGQLADPESGFYYNLNRDYMPNLGRYLESDPIGISGGVGTYTYTLDKPNRFIDTDGLQESDTFLPPEFYGQNAPQIVTPGTPYVDWFKYNNDTGEQEYSRAFYDSFGRQIGRTDFTDHGTCDVHANPHYHITEYSPSDRPGGGFDPFFGRESGPLPGEFPDGPAPSVIPPELTHPSSGGGGSGMLGPFDIMHPNSHNPNPLDPEHIIE